MTTLSIVMTTARIDVKLSLNTFSVPPRGPATYQLTIDVGGHVFHVDRRYSEFVALHAALSKLLGGRVDSLPRLPPKMPPWAARGPLAARRFPRLASYVMALGGNDVALCSSAGAQFCEMASVALFAELASDRQCALRMLEEPLDLGTGMVASNGTHSISSLCVERSYRQMAPTIALEAPLHEPTAVELPALRSAAPDLSRASSKANFVRTSSKANLSRAPSKPNISRASSMPSFVDEDMAEMLGLTTAPCELELARTPTQSQAPAAKWALYIAELNEQDLSGFDEVDDETIEPLSATSTRRHSSEPCQSQGNDSAAASLTWKADVFDANAVSDSLANM